MNLVAHKIVTQASCIAHIQFNVLNILPNRFHRTILSIENVFWKEGKEKNKWREKSKGKREGIISDISNSGLDYRLIDRVVG